MEFVSIQTRIVQRHTLKLKIGGGHSPHFSEFTTKNHSETLKENSEIGIFFVEIRYQRQQQHFMKERGR